MAKRLPDIEEWVKSVERSSPVDPRELDWGLNSNPNAMATTEPQATQCIIAPSLFSAPPPPQPHTLTPSSPHRSTQQPVVTSDSLTEKKRSSDDTQTAPTVNSPANFLHSDNQPLMDIASTGALLDSSSRTQHHETEWTFSPTKAINASRRLLKSPLPNPTAEPRQPTFVPSPGSKRKMLKSNTFAFNRPNFKSGEKRFLRTAVSLSIPAPLSAPSTPVISRNPTTSGIISTDSERVRKTSLSHTDIEKYLDESEQACAGSISSSESMDSMRKYGGDTPSPRRQSEEGSASLSPNNSEDIEAVLARLESSSALLGVDASSDGLSAEKTSDKADGTSPSRSPLVRQRCTSHSPSPPSHRPPSTSPPPSSPPHSELSQHQLQRHEKLQGRKFTFDTTNDDAFYQPGTQQRFFSRRSIPHFPSSSPSPAAHPHKAHTVTHTPPRSVSDYSSSLSSSISHDSSGKSHGSHMTGRRSSSPVYNPSHYRSHSLGKYQLPLVTVKESHENPTHKVAIGRVSSPLGGAKAGSITQMILKHRQKQQKEKEGKALSLLGASGSAAAAAAGEGGGGGGGGKHVNRQDSGIGTISNASAL